jgi:NDP-sugar pyrophosphorylase family protein
MEPDVLHYIPVRVPFGFDDLLLCLLGRGLPAFTFPHNGTWLDIGRVEDFQSAQDLAWDDQQPAYETVVDHHPGYPHASIRNGETNGHTGNGQILDDQLPRNVA